MSLVETRSSRWCVRFVPASVPKIEFTRLWLSRTLFVHSSQYCTELRVFHLYHIHWSPCVADIPYMPEAGPIAAQLRVPGGPGLVYGEQPDSIRGPARRRCVLFVRGHVLWQAEKPAITRSPENF
jgi:hypothetical protein